MYRNLHVGTFFLFFPHKFSALLTKKCDFFFKKISFLHLFVKYLKNTTLDEKKKTCFYDVDMSFLTHFSPLAWKAMGDIVIANPSVCTSVYVPVYVPVWLGFCYSGLLEKVEVRLQLNLGQRWNRGSFIMLMRSKVTYQGQGSSEVKLGGKCWFSIFGSPLKVEVRLEPNLGQRCRAPLYVNKVKGHVPRSWVIWG